MSSGCGDATPCRHAGSSPSLTIHLHRSRSSTPDVALHGVKYDRDHGSKSTHRRTLRAQLFRRSTESDSTPVTGRAVGEEDYSHGNIITQCHERSEKEEGYEEKSVSARDEAKGEGR